MFSFQDAAFIGKQPGNTTAETLATLGLSSSAGVVLDYAFLGLYPGRFTARRAAFVGLLDVDATQPPAAIKRSGRRRRQRVETEEELMLCGVM